MKKMSVRECVDMDMKHIYRLESAKIELTFDQQARFACGV